MPFPRIWSAGMEVPAILAFQPDRGENARPVGARVDANAVAPLVDGFGDRMPVDDHEPVIRAAVQECRPDPAEVHLALAAKVDSRSDSGMDEQIIAEAEGVVKRAQELGMLLRDCRAKLRD